MKADVGWWRVLVSPAAGGDAVGDGGGRCRCNKERRRRWAGSPVRRCCLPLHQAALASAVAASPSRSPLRKADDNGAGFLVTTGEELGRCNESATAVGAVVRRDSGAGWF
nr:hypothetical protein Itr_chr05CG20270 [Ipomoea trifida]